MVGGTWIEHVTSSVSRKRSPTELTARGAMDGANGQDSQPGVVALLSGV
jgi:hypothetical protein